MAIAVEADLRRKFEALPPQMNEAVARQWAAADARALGRGGIAWLAHATGMSRNDVTRNEGWVSVGIDHDTAGFAAATMGQWWRRMGQTRYRYATALYLTADGGGGNGSRHRLWKQEMQRLADDTGLTIHVSHLPPGTGKWDKIEHRMFGRITKNWRGRPLETLKPAVELIAHTQTTTGLHVRAAVDTRPYPTGLEVPDAEMRALRITRADFHGEWNYTIHPRPVDPNK